MSMEREVIMIDGRGNIIMPTDIAHVWMSEPELVELFGIVAPTLRAAVRAVYKCGVLKEYEAQKFVRLGNGFYADVFGFTMVAALAFRINTFGAEQVRNAIFERLYLRKEKTSIFFSLNVNGIALPKFQT